MGRLQLTLSPLCNVVYIILGGHQILSLSPRAGKVKPYQVITNCQKLVEIRNHVPAPLHPQVSEIPLIWDWELTKRSRYACIYKCPDWRTNEYHGPLQTRFGECDTLLYILSDLGYQVCLSIYNEIPKSYTFTRGMCMMCTYVRIYGWESPDGVISKLNCTSKT